MDVLHKYELSPVDYWAGMPTLQSYFAQSGKKHDDDEFELSDGVESFVFGCLQQCGPIRSAYHVRLLFSPLLEAVNTELIAVFIKEDNNGTVKVFSKYPLPWLESD